MKTEQLMINGYGGINLPAIVWQPEQDVKAVLQITHGMTEYMGRYESMAADLCSHGIAVAGFDLRGHGKNPGNSEIASFGEGGWAASIEDMRLFFLQLTRLRVTLSRDSLSICLKRHRQVRCSVSRLLLTVKS